MFRFFHPLSLDAISKTLSDKECATLNKFEIERRKGMFPYEWLDSVNKFNETSLPPKEVFFSILKQSGITCEEYKQALDCWKESGCGTIKDYLMLCLETVVLLSVDVFERLRGKCLKYCEKHLCYTYSTPRLTWLCR